MGSYSTYHILLHLLLNIGDIEMKFAITIISLYIVNCFILFSQDILTLKTDSTKFTLEHYLHSHKANYLKFSGNCDCFQMYNDSIILREDNISSIYKGWDFTKQNSLTIEILLNELFKHFILIDYEIYNNDFINENKVRYLTYNFYRDTISYYQLIICIGNKSVFDSKDDLTDLKKALTIKDYCAYFKIINNKKNIDGYIKLKQVLIHQKVQNGKKSCLDVL